MHTMVIEASNLSYSGDKGKGGGKFEIRMGNLGRPCLKRKKKKRLKGGM